MAYSYRNRIYQWQGDDSQPYPNNYIWKSRQYIFSKEITFNCARVIADTGDRQDYYDSLEAQRLQIDRNNQRISGLLLHGSIGEDPVAQLAINGDELEEVSTVAAYSGDFNLSVKFYVNESLIFTKEVYATDKPFRIEGGIRGKKFEIQIEGNVIIRRFDMATSMKLLTEDNNG